MTKLTRQTNSRLSQRKRGTSPSRFTFQRIFANTPAVNVVLLSAFMSLGLAYLGVVNSAASDTFRVSELQDQLELAQEQERSLELAITEVQSLQHIKAMSEDKQLVAGGTVEYASTNTAVALSQ